MPAQDPKTIATAWWRFNDERTFSDAAALCAPDCVIDWPLSNERFGSPTLWLAAMRHYPGVWRCSIRALMSEDDRVMTVVDVSDPTISHTAISLFRIRRGEIAELIEYWPEPYDPPAWRAGWVTPIPFPNGQRATSTGETP